MMLLVKRSETKVVDIIAIAHLVMKCLQHKRMNLNLLQCQNWSKSLMCLLTAMCPTYPLIVVFSLTLDLLCITLVLHYSTTHLCMLAAVQGKVLTVVAAVITDPSPQHYPHK